jgi:hypothetical protein
MRRPLRNTTVLVLLALAAWLGGGPVCAQEPPAAPTAPAALAPPAPTPSAGGDEGGPTSEGSNVGYIDSALPLRQFRLRYDAAYNSNRPNRAEFFYAKGFPGGPGVPLPETRVDYQDLSAYLEMATGDRFSAFVELPVRFLNPEINRDTAGFADMNAGFKYAFWQSDCRTATFQLRTYIPTGAASQGLGTRHVSLEPALLVFLPLGERLTFEGELRYWIPIGGTDFAGDVIRYGVGLSYTVVQSCTWRVAPVAEFVGWTVLGGKESAPPGLEQDAAGDTIVNVKLGVRARFQDVGDVYAGYGRVLTGDRWYENILRLEFRLLF